MAEPAPKTILLQVAYTYVSICYMKRTTVYLTQEQIDRLAKLSEKTGAPAAELIRRAINQYLKSQGVR